MTSIETFAGAAEHGDLSGAMVALCPTAEDAARLAVDGGHDPEDMHVTLCFLGDGAAIDDDMRTALKSAVTTQFKPAGAAVGNVWAIANFNPDGDSQCAVYLVGSTDGHRALSEYKLAAHAALAEAKFSAPDQHDPWVPHITAGYGVDPDTIPLENLGPITFDRVRLAIGGENHDVPLAAPVTAGGEPLAAAAVNDLNRTDAGNVLDQRFAEIALASTACIQRSGWAEGNVAGIVDLWADGIADVSYAETDWARQWLATSETDGTLHVTVYSNGEWIVSAAAATPENARSLADAVSGRFPPMTMDASDGTVPVQFWAMGPMGPVSYWRRLDVTDWSTVADNYPTATSADLDAIMNMSAPDGTTGGRLVLWTGPPGSGKTNAIRALAAAWSPWCSVDYIVDADEFFGHASYMVSALVGDNGDDKWRLVVIEDAGEFLTSEAAAKTGQGLSRLLNLTDGLVGQGLKLIVLMTTNEPVETLHPALTRPGRCMANLVLGQFSKKEADAWLASRGLPKIGHAASLAELYALVPPPAPAVEAGTVGPSKEDRTMPDETLTETLSAATQAVTANTNPATATLTINVDLDGVTAAAAPRTLTFDLQNVPMLDGVEGPGEWTAVMVVEGVKTGDGRIISEEALTWRDLPFTLQWAKEDMGGHYGAVPVGAILTITREGNEVRAAGTWDSGEDGQECRRMVEEKTIKGVSVDLDDVTVSYEPDMDAIAEQAAEATVAECDECMPDVFDLPILERVIAGRISALTVCSIPAFQEAFIENVVADGGLITSGELGAYRIDVWAADESLVAAFAVAPAPARTEPRIVVPAGLPFTTDGSVDLLTPPEAWFADPALTEPTLLTVTAEGRVFGHLAQFGVCHRGLGNRCVLAESTSRDMSEFLQGATHTAEGGRVRTGVLTCGTDHAGLDLGINETRSHYTHSGTAVAAVNAGWDDHGIWVAGALAPGATVDQVWRLRAMTLSGDWRDRDLKLTAALVVPVGGFPKYPRSIIASGEAVSLVAAGVLARPPLTGTDALIASLLAQLDAQASETSELRASVEALQLAELDRRVALSTI